MNMDHRNKGHAMSRVAALVFSSMVLFFVEGCVDAGSLPLDTIKLPPGFAITVYADNVPNARGMALGGTAPCLSAARRKATSTLSSTKTVISALMRS